MSLQLHWLRINRGTCPSSQHRQEIIEARQFGELRASHTFPRVKLYPSWNSTVSSWRVQNAPRYRIFLLIANWFSVREFYAARDSRWTREKRYAAFPCVSFAFPFFFRQCKLEGEKPAGLFYKNEVDWAAGSYLPSAEFPSVRIEPRWHVAFVKVYGLLDILIRYACLFNNLESSK